MERAKKRSLADGQRLSPPCLILMLVRHFPHKPEAETLKSNVPSQHTTICSTSPNDDACCLLSATITRTITTQRRQDVSTTTMPYIRNAHITTGASTALPRFRRPQLLSSPLHSHWHRQNDISKHDTNTMAAVGSTSPPRSAWRPPSPVQESARSGSTPMRSTRSPTPTPARPFAN